MAALRRYATAGPLCPEVPPPSAGVITAGSDHRIGAVSPQAQLWLDQWSAHGAPPWVAEAFFVSLSLVARAEARREGGSIPLVCAPPAATGRWTTCQGHVLDAGGTGDVALVIQGATWDLVLPSLCEWYGITPGNAMSSRSSARGRPSSRSPAASACPRTRSTTTSRQSSARPGRTGATNSVPP